MSTFQSPQIRFRQRSVTQQASMIYAMDTPPISGTCVRRLSSVDIADYEHVIVSPAVLQKAATVQGRNLVVEELIESEVQAAHSRDNKKRVHFGEDGLGLCSDTLTIPPVTSIEADLLWWDGDSLENRRSCDKVLVDSQRENHAYHESIMFLMRSYESKHQCRQNLIDRVKTVRDADVRGLEQRVVTALKVYRNASVNEVLKLHRKLRKEGTIRPEMATVMLRQKSLKMSRAARQLSFRLAQADRQDAKEIHGENKS